ncbi:hypothetical protein [Metabacillus fastidiosus]|uniref:hypothetical protein n=1 Tax=Metabacillus fastidiosus TaxID=1458 RepID=UPI003D2A22E0
MNVIGLTEKESNSFLKRIEDPYRDVNRKNKGNVDKRYKRLEWLVMSVKVDDDKKYSLGQWIKLAPKISQGSKEPLDMFRDAIRLDPETFYEEYELNWYIAFDETLTFLAELKQLDYETYTDFIQEVYRED